MKLVATDAWERFDAQVTWYEPEPTKHRQQRLYTSRSGVCAAVESIRSVGGCNDAVDVFETTNVCNDIKQKCRWPATSSNSKEEMVEAPSEVRQSDRQPYSQYRVRKAVKIINHGGRRRHRLHKRRKRRRRLLLLLYRRRHVRSWKKNGKTRKRASSARDKRLLISSMRPSYTSHLKPHDSRVLTSRHVASTSLALARLLARQAICAFV